MRGFSEALRLSVAAAMDGASPVAFERLDLAPPEKLCLPDGRTALIPDPESLSALAEEATRRLSFFLRPSFVGDLAAALAAPDSGAYERTALRAILDNALCAAEGVLPLCQDTGTATLYAWKGELVLPPAGASLEAAMERGILGAWKRHLLRNSQVAPAGRDGSGLLFERNTGTNAPAFQEWFSCPGDAAHFLFVAKGGGSSNKTSLFQETKRILEPDRMRAFIDAAVRGLGVSACPPYTLALVLGGQGPEESVLAARLAATGALDALPANSADGSPCRDPELEAMLLECAAGSGWGAQFGGRYMARAARVIRLTRHAASFPVALALSCSAHRQLYARVDASGYHIERLADGADIAGIMAAHGIAAAAHGIAAAAHGIAAAAHGIAAAAHEIPGEKRDARPERVDLSLGKAAWQGLEAGRMVLLSGPVILARDAAHARLAAMMARGESLPDWCRYPVYYAGPTGTPEGLPSGSLGPTTSKRMDSYLDSFMARGVFPCSIGKGERSPSCAAACAKHGGAYFAAVGGAAAIAAKRHVRSSRVLDWEDLGMEAVRLVELRDLPALVACDARGGDYYARLSDQRR